MKTLFLLFSFLLCHYAFSLGDTSLLPASPGAMTDTVGTLNQVTEESDGKGTMNQQDQQEKQFKEDREREMREWNESKTSRQKLHEGRFDVPEE